MEFDGMVGETVPNESKMKWFIYVVCQQHSMLQICNVRFFGVLDKLATVFKA